MNHKALVFLLVAVVVLTLVHTFIFVSDISETTGAAHQGFVQDDLVTISEPDAYGFVTVEGKTGAVAGHAKVVVTNLRNRESTHTYAGSQGSFSLAMPASGMDYLRIEAE